MDKKAALQLSINAIVVLILAMTILGLGLSFIKNMFGSSVDQMEQISSEVRDGVLQKAKESGELLYVGNTQMEMSRGKPKDFIFAATNTAAAADDFKLTFTCTNAIGTATCPTDAELEVWFSTFDDVEIESKDSKVFPVKVTPDTIGDFMIKVTLSGTDGGDITSKDLYLTVK